MRWQLHLPEVQLSSQSQHVPTEQVIKNPDEIHSQLALPVLNLTDPAK